MSDQNHVEIDGVRYEAVVTSERANCAAWCALFERNNCRNTPCSPIERTDHKYAYWVKSATTPAATPPTTPPATPPKKRRVRMFKEDYVAQITILKIDLHNAQVINRKFAEENIRLRARDGKLTGAASFLAVLVIVLAFLLIGGAR